MAASRIKGFRDIPLTAKMKANAILLLSGGMDSATVLALLQSEGWQVLALSFAYGQCHSFELEKAAKLAKLYGVRHLVLKLDPQLFMGTALVGDKIAVPEARQPTDIISGTIPVTYVPARNILFLSHALALAESYASYDIFIGVNAVDYSGYPDCRPEFLEAFRQMSQVGTRTGVEGKAIQIHAPLLHLSKKEIIQKGTELGLDYGLTSTCYQPDAEGRPCQKCDSCILRQRGFHEAGLADPLAHIES